MTAKNCPNCAAPLPTVSPVAGLVCDFCHTIVKQPELPVLDAEIIDEHPPGGAEPGWITKLRRERLDIKNEHTRQVVFTLLSVFLVLIPGLATAIFGTIVSCLAHNFLNAAVCLLGGIAVGGIGIALVVYFGLGQTRCNERIRELEQRIGIDNRTRAEKLVDHGMDWMFGKQ